jgi:hypothetical protein
MFRQRHHVAILDWGLALLVGVLLVTPAFSAEESKEFRTGEKAILAALEEKTSLEFLEEPICNVVAHFKEVHRVEIQLDFRALEDVNIGTDTPITKSIQNVTFRSALNLVLRDLDLTWVIRDEVLMITTPEEAELQLITRVYDVGKLVTVQDQDGRQWQDFDSLIRAITPTVAPESWADVGGPGTIAPLEYRGAVVLIVRQTHEVHAQLVKLLEELTKIAAAYGDDEYPVREKMASRSARFGMPGSGGMGGMGGMSGGGLGGGGSGKPMGDGFM